MLLAIAGENNLSETAFWRTRDIAARQYDLRWFTPTTEVDLCGHATLSTAHVIMNELGGEPQSVSLTFFTKSGPLLVKALEDGRLQMDFPMYTNLSRPDLIQAVGEALGTQPIEVLWAEGNRDAVAIFGSSACILNLRPKFPLFASLPCLAVIATAAMDSGMKREEVVSCATTAPLSTYDFVYRFFGPKIGITEDPVTGSAQCSIAPIWSLRLGKTKLISQQVSQRRGDVWAECVTEGGVGQAECGRVLVSGRAVTVIRGQILVPSSTHGSKEETKHHT